MHRVFHFIVDLRTPVEYTPTTPRSDVSTSSLFQNDGSVTDFLATQPIIGSTNSSKSLFPATNDAFLTSSNIQQRFFAASITGQSAPPHSNAAEKKYPSIQQKYQKENSPTMNPISTMKPTRKLYEQTNYTLQSQINSGIEAPNFASNGVVPTSLAKQRQGFLQSNPSVQNGTAMGHNLPSVTNYQPVSTFIPNKLQSNNTSDTFPPLKHPLQTVPVSDTLKPSINITNNIPSKSSTSNNPVLNISNNPSSKSHQSPYQATNFFQASASSTEQASNSQLFIPNMYSTSNSSGNNSDMKQTFFTPSTPAANPLPEQLYRQQGNGSITTPGVAESAHQENSYQQDQSYTYNQSTNFGDPSQQAGGSFQLVTGKDGKGKNCHYLKPRNYQGKHFLIG